MSEREVITEAQYQELLKTDPERAATFRPIEPQTHAKPGRNWMCPCGSGKKYKKCCLVTKQAEIQKVFENFREKEGGSKTIVLTRSMR